MKWIRLPAKMSLLMSRVQRIVRIGLLWVGGLSLVPKVGWAKDELDLEVINRIIQEGLRYSELPETAAYLMDRIGGRMTNSPQMRLAEKWTQQRFRSWGLERVHAEGFDFGRGWSIERIEVRMTEPRVLPLQAIPVAWTPPTKGRLTAPIIVAPMERERDFEKWKGKLEGKIVFVTKPSAGSEPKKVPFERLSAAELQRLDEYPHLEHSEAKMAKRLKHSVFTKRLEAFLAAEGAQAWVRESYRDGGLLHGEGYGYRLGQTSPLPGIEMKAEDYRRLARLAKAGVTPTLELLSEVRFYDEDHNAYNVFAEVPGRNPRAGYVMAGAHLDSWVAADGAQDNGAGSVVVMEASRILSKLGLKPRRTIRFALWSGEEQGLVGSMAFVERHLARRAPITDPKIAEANTYYSWDTRWPVDLLPGSKELTAYFNIDNGSGKIRGIYAEGNVAVIPILEKWLRPFASMGVDKVVARHTWGTDHVPMQVTGIPAFQFIQDPLDYSSRIHHSSIDTYDHLEVADLEQASVVLASMLWLSAERDQPLPRLPVQRKPKETDPFNYDEVDDD